MKRSRRRKWHERTLEYRTRTSKYRQTRNTCRLTVGVKHVAGEPHLRRTERIIRGEAEHRWKHSAFKTRILRTPETQTHTDTHRHTTELSIDISFFVFSSHDALDDVNRKYNVAMDSVSYLLATTEVLWRFYGWFGRFWLSHQRFVDDLVVLLEVAGSLGGSRPPSDCFRGQRTSSSSQIVFSALWSKQWFQESCRFLTEKKHQVCSAGTTLRNFIWTLTSCHSSVCPEPVLHQVLWSASSQSQWSISEGGLFLSSQLYYQTSCLNIWTHTLTLSHTHTHTHTHTHPFLYKSQFDKTLSTVTTDQIKERLTEAVSSLSSHPVPVRSSAVQSIKLIKGHKKKHLTERR